MLSHSARRHAITSALAITVVFFWSSDAHAARDLGSLATQLKSNLGGVADLIGTIIFMIGIVLAGMGIYKFRQGQHNHQPGALAEAISLFVVGSMLVALPTAMGVGVTSIFGDTAGTLSVDSNSLRSIR